LSDDDQIPPLVRELIRERIRSIEALEVVVLLRERAAEALSLDELARLLRLGRPSVEQAVDELSVVSFLEREPDGRVRYAPGPGATDAAVDALVHTYQHQRVEILVFISQSALSRVRDNALRTFAEAFRVRGKK
jgi:hypothetical protein